MESILTLNVISLHVYYITMMMCYPRETLYCSYTYKKLDLLLIKLADLVF